MKITSSTIISAILLLCALLWKGGFAAGFFELRVVRLAAESDLPCPEPCGLYVQACLKQFQSKVTVREACIYGADRTQVLRPSVIQDGAERPDALMTPRMTPDWAGRPEALIQIAFHFSWPRTFALILEIRNITDAVLLERAISVGEAQPGEVWRSFTHRGKDIMLQYEVRVRCQENYYRGDCTHFCRPRFDFVGHFVCDKMGNKTCVAGWTGPDCKQAKCKRGCHPEHGHCPKPRECKCQYGWQGERCDECTPYPGCLHGTCGNKPWTCFCKINWGGLLCNMDLNYCGTHSPCLNGATCINVEPNKYRCLCLPGFEGENCHIEKKTCTKTCQNGGTCEVQEENPQCICPLGFRGLHCEVHEHYCPTTLCQNGGRCLDTTTAGQACHCLPGFEGMFCEIPTKSESCSSGHCTERRKLGVGAVLAIFFSAFFLFFLLCVFILLYYYYCHHVRQRQHDVHHNVPANNAAHQSQALHPRTNVKNVNCSAQDGSSGERQKFHEVVYIPPAHKGKIDKSNIRCYDDQDRDSLCGIPELEPLSS
uniref:protein jagged-1b-like n=1 Tax=Myxine glutinosa TaxID=7769 RepID=UPI00358E2685